MSGKEPASWSKSGQVLAAIRRMKRAGICEFTRADVRAEVADTDVDEHDVNISVIYLCRCGMIEKCGQTESAERTSGPKQVTLFRLISDSHHESRQQRPERKPEHYPAVHHWAWRDEWIKGTPVPQMAADYGVCQQAVQFALSKYFKRDSQPKDYRRCTSKSVAAYRRTLMMAKSYGASHNQWLRLNAKHEDFSQLLSRFCQARRRANREAVVFSISLPDYFQMAASAKQAGAMVVRRDLAKGFTKANLFVGFPKQLQSKEKSREKPPQSRK